MLSFCDVRLEHSGCEPLAAFPSLPCGHGMLRATLLGTVVAIPMPQTCTGSCEPIFFHNLENAHDRSRFLFEAASPQPAPQSHVGAEAHPGPAKARDTSSAHRRLRTRPPAQPRLLPA